MKPIFWILVTLVIATTSVSAQEYKSDTWLGGISAQWLLIDSDTTFSIHVQDSVQDGCWTNIEAVKNAVTLELTRSGYTIDDASYADFRIWISGLGGTASSTGCAVSYRCFIPFTGYASQVEYSHEQGCSEYP